VRTDPLRNFKFQVQFVPPANNINVGAINPATFGFMSVSGANVSTETIPYREGGWNTAPHKFPGQSDFGPITCMTGVYANPNNPGDVRQQLWDLQRQLFAINWGGGSLKQGDDFRFDAIVRVLNHPVTAGPASGSADTPEGAALAMKFYNCWISAYALGDLNAGDNAILVQQLTFVHEGVDLAWGTPASAASPFAA
jgi:phage tail-like protein